MAGISTIHPVHRHAFSVSEHPEGQLHGLGDALGCDCIIERFADGWMRKHRNDGLRNDDWYGWGEEVLAPFDSSIEAVYINEQTNDRVISPILERVRLHFCVQMGFEFATRT
ncbi:hypothetical protein [Paenibacillus sp. ISL-20]|uniref:hypothetical protein n=1 Tax=Paenibacillus sp. ISL-20 TaxID=2819163 RepID=UPI001BE9626C|nr:hypothetical protein [Paenibacillus sp. ISL-20]MBT2765574.1 hypothetical protein [Paenibacillus sp. ISL-20]